MKWGVGIVFVVLVAVAFVVFWLRKVYAPATPQDIPMQEIKITSSAFGNNKTIPARYTCDDKEVSPPLEISGVPAGTKSLALIMHDPDAPRAGGWTHWVKYNMKMNYDLGFMNIEEGKEPEGVAGKGTGGELTYQGPCPPSGTHRYFFTVYALDAELSLKEGAAKVEVEKAMKGHIIGQRELIGLYARKQ